MGYGGEISGRTKTGNRIGSHSQNETPISTRNHQQMAGVKGRSGGPRANSGGARPNSGGKRPGAGRKPKAKPESPANAPKVQVGLEPQVHGGALKRSKAEQSEPSEALADGKTRQPLEFLELVMNDPSAPLKDRIRAAVAAAQYRHTKRHDGGKKDEVGEKAKKASGGRFGVRQAPSLKVVGG